MARALDTAVLPPILAMALWPWIDIVEAAAGGMGSHVRLTAENTVAVLWGRVAMSPPLVAAIEDALHASDALAREVDRQGFLGSKARIEALLALNGLIALLGAQS